MATVPVEPTVTPLRQRIHAVVQPRVDHSLTALDASLGTAFCGV